MTAQVKIGSEQILAIIGIFLKDHGVLPGDYMDIQLDFEEYDDGTSDLVATASTETDDESWSLGAVKERIYKALVAYGAISQPCYYEADFGENQENAY